MKRYTKLKWGILAELALLFVLLAVKLSSERAEDASSAAVVAEEEEEAEQEYIKWVDFDVTGEALSQAYEADVDTYGTDWHVDWISLLAYGAAKNGGIFNQRTLADMKDGLLYTSGLSSTATACRRREKPKTVLTSEALKTRCGHLALR